MVESAGRIALLAGASGLVGGRLLALLLQSPQYTRVHALSRRPLLFDHPRLANRVVRFEASLQAQLKGLQCQDAFCCLGTTIREAGSQAAFRAVDLDLVLGYAQLALGCGAHIDQLVRTASGPFHLGQAFTLEQLQCLKDEGRLEVALLRPAELLPHFPPVYMDELTVRQIRQGRDFSVSPFRVNQGTEYVKAIGPDGDLVAIGRIVLPHLYHPVIVLETSRAKSSSSNGSGDSQSPEWTGEI